MARLFYQRLSTNGDGTGTSNMNVDGSITPVTFKIAPSAGETVKISRVMIYIEDGGSFDSGEWGNGVELTNGISFKQKENDVTTDLLGFSVKTSGEMASVCHDIDHRAFGAGNEFLSFRWTFTKAGATIDLTGNTTADESDELQVVVSDDLTGLVKMYILAQGVYA